MQEKIVKLLLDPKSYPESERPQEVACIQTHISYIFLAGDYVYKLKKPVNFGFLDFTTKERRKYYCERELLLNQRLARPLYLEVIPIMENQDGIKIGGKGKEIESLLKMRRIPEEDFFTTRLKQGKITRGTMEDLAKVIFTFHQNAETNKEISKFGELDVVRGNTEENFVQTKKYIDLTIREKDYQAIKTATDRFYKIHPDLFKKRIARGKIRDGHGDIRMEHIAFMPDGEIAIFDCIEFNERFRHGDVISDMSFLVMDLDFMGQEDLGRDFTRAYYYFSQDEDLEILLPFYLCYRAYVRGKVESFLLDDPHLKVEEKEKAKASKYFKLALGYAQKFTL